VAGPDRYSFGAIDPGSVPPVSPFEGADPSFAAGAPLHGPPKRRRTSSLLRRPATAIRFAALANEPESVGYATFAGTTVVSAATGRCAAPSPGPPWPATPRSARRSRPLRSGSSTSSTSSGAWPPVQRDPAEPPPGDRIGDLPAHRLVAKAVPELEEHEPQVGLHRRRRSTRGRGKNGTNGPKNTSSSSRRSTRSSSICSRRTSSGRTGSEPPPKPWRHAL
jgi:hypothetical protein